MANSFLKALGKVGTVIRTIAPTIATAMGGPLAGSAVSALTKAIGMPETSTPEQIQEKLISSTDPATYAAIKKADEEYAIQLKQAGVDLEKIAEADRESARGREVALKDKTPRNLAYLIMLGFFAFSASGILIYFRETISPEKLATLSGFIGTVLGYLVSEAKQITNYYFGSSAGSDKKTDIINGLSKE